MQTFALLPNFGTWEMLLILALGLLLFGKRLPEVGRSLGKGIVEFERGLKGIGDEIEQESSKSESAPAPRRPAQQLPRSDEPADRRESWQGSTQARAEERVSRADNVD